MGKRVLLCNPPFYRLLGSKYLANSLGISYIAAVLNQNGHDAWLYNADAYFDDPSYKNLKGLFDGFHDYKQYFKNKDHEIWEEVTRKIIDFNPDWVGWTSYTANVSTIQILSEKLHNIAPEIRQVVGGPHSTMDNNLLLKLPYVDFAVKREGEYAMLELINDNDPKKIIGVVSKNKLGFLHNNGDADVLDTDLLPFPERDKFWAMTEEQKNKIDVSYVISIRGCPYDCTYCASPKHWGRSKTQYRSPKSLLSEMHHVKKHYWNKHQFDYSQSANATTKDKLIIQDNSVFYIVDDVFSVKKNRTIETLNMMIDTNLDAPWKCEARTDHLIPEICKLMKQANCVRVKIGAESGSDRILKQVSKRETKKQIYDGCMMLKDAGVPFTLYLMAGFPGETDEDLRQTIEFAKAVKPNFCSLSILSPYFGTAIYYDLIEQGFPLDKQPWEYFFHQSSDLMVNNTISKEVLQEYLALNETLNKDKNNLGYV